MRRSFPMGDKNVRIAQVNTVDLKEVFDRQAELETTMALENTKKAMTYSC